MTQLAAWILATVVAAAGVSGVIFALSTSGGGVSIQPGTETTTIPSANNAPPPSYTTLSVQVTTTFTINASNGPGGCGFSSTTASNQGYNLTVYVSSYSLTIGQTECMAAVIQDNSTVPVTSNQSLSLTFSVTNSTGYVVDSPAACPNAAIATTATTVNPSPPATPPPAQAFECGDFWDTSASVNGAPLQPGLYHIIVIGSLTRGGILEPVTVSEQVNVTLSAA
jgi:hypothetical protein